MVKAGGIGKGGRATAVEEMDGTDSGGDGDQAAAANFGGGGGELWRQPRLIVAAASAAAGNDYKDGVVAVKKIVFEFFSILRSANEAVCLSG